MRTLSLLSLMLLAVQLGCAAVGDTPAQVLAQERWEQCKGASPGVQLREIRPNGQIWVWSTDSGKAFLECDRRVANDQALRRKMSGPGN